MGSFVAINNKQISVRSSKLHETYFTIFLHKCNLHIVEQTCIHNHWEVEKKFLKQNLNKICIFYNIKSPKTPGDFSKIPQYLGVLNSCPQPLPPARGCISWQNSTLLGYRYCEYTLESFHILLLYSLNQPPRLTPLTVPSPQLRAEPKVT